MLDSIRMALGRRGDSRVLAPLLAALEEDAVSGFSGTLPLEAAAELANPRLYPVLLRLRDHWRDDRSWVLAELEGAIEKCRPPA